MLIILHNPELVVPFCNKACLMPHISKNVLDREKYITFHEIGPQTEAMFFYVKRFLNDTVMSKMIDVRSCVAGFMLLCGIATEVQ